MTATLSSALTSVKIEKYDVTTGKRVGYKKITFEKITNVHTFLFILKQQTNKWSPKSEVIQ